MPVEWDRSPNLTNGRTGRPGEGVLGNGAFTYPAHAAEDPSVASGTLTPGETTVPWVVWAEDTGSGRHAIFISRLVGGTHFELLNGGAPVSDTRHDAVSPDITFFGSIPYVSWIESVGGVQRGFVGHFLSGAFVLDTPGGTIVASNGRPASLIDSRVPISSNCTSDPFTSDGTLCPAAAVNDPFFLFTTADSPQRLFGETLIGGLTAFSSLGAALPFRPRGVAR